MSLRHDILKQVQATGGATIDDIIDATGQTRRQLHNNLKAAVDDGLLTRAKDVVTGLPLYTITAKGHQRLAVGPDAKLCHEQHDAQPAVAKNTGSRESVPPVGQVSPPAEVAATETTTPGAGHDAPAVSKQPQPKGSSSPYIWRIVIGDMVERNNVGIQRYGVPLQANNGRDMLVDAYQEALDLAVYLRGAIFERDGA